MLSYGHALGLSRENHSFLIFYESFVFLSVGVIHFALGRFFGEVAAGGIEAGGPQGCRATAPRGAEATLGATATPLGPRPAPADHC